MIVRHAAALLRHAADGDGLNALGCRQRPANIFKDTARDLLFRKIHPLMRATDDGVNQLRARRITRCIVNVFRKEPLRGAPG
jgi:hypothetical protein